VPHKNRKLHELVGEHMSTQLSPPLRVLSQQLDQVVEVLNREGHAALLSQVYGRA
jgi:hypothetical protein